jgi:Putative MetA-pathway of phenol degradation
MIMTARFALLLCTSVSLALCGVAAAQQAADPPTWTSRTLLKATLGYHFSTGTYGESKSTEIFYIPLTLRADLDLWRLQVTVPYIRIDGPGTEGIDGPVSGTGGEGLGDILAELSYALAPLTAWMPWLELGGTIKFPTADKDKGLGTGEFDYTIEVVASRRIARFTPYVTVGYRFFGDPKGFDLHDVPLAAVGTSYQLREPLDVGLELYFREASSSSSDPLLEVTPWIGWQLTPHWSSSTYVTAGILDGSPDFGIGLQVGYEY